MTCYGDEAVPALSDEQWARLRANGSAQEVESGALLFGAGAGATHDLILVDSGEGAAWDFATAARNWAPLQDDQDITDSLTCLSGS